MSMRLAVRIGAVLLILAGLALVSRALLIQPGPDPSTIVPRSVSTMPPPPSERAHKPGMQASAPVRIIIPSINVSAPVMIVGASGGTVGVPPLSISNLTGWYDRSVTPGQNGSSLIDGHVDTKAGPSVFFNLKNLRPGDEIRINREDGSTVLFRVTWIQVVSKASFPWHAVLGPVSDPELRLVTCGGPFDYRTGHYLDNIVVYAHLAGAT